MTYPLDNALFEWEDGDRRLRQMEEDPANRRRTIRAVDAVRDELRRRIGPTFTAEQLAELYGRGTDWALQTAHNALPDEVPDWDPQVIIDAAFYMHLRGALDWAGGRRVVVE